MIQEKIKTKNRYLNLFFISLATLILILTSLYIFQKAEYKQHQISFPDLHLLLDKINHPLELERKNKTLFNWVIKQPIFNAYEICEPYFSKGLKSEDYSIEDLLGDKSIIFCLDKNKKALVYIPLSNNDNFFIDPVLQFLKSSPLGIKINKNIYSITQAGTTIYFSISNRMMIFSQSELSLFKANSTSENSRLTQLINAKN
tara:strand:- start:367 stop:969 length:603 start_codon:yes stop_codon:yes gene_type:complete